MKLQLFYIWVKWCLEGTSLGEGGALVKTAHMSRGGASGVCLSGGKLVVYPVCEKMEKACPLLLLDPVLMEYSWRTAFSLPFYIEAFPLTPFTLQTKNAHKLREYIM